MTGSACLVTGAAGFIGSHLVRALVARGDMVHAVVRSGSSLDRLEDISDQIVLHRFDLADGDALAACLQQAVPQKVFHLAASTRDAGAPDPASLAAGVADYLDPLFTLLSQLSNALSPPLVMVRTGTIAEYGLAPTPYREDLREYPQTPYGARVLAGTHHIEMLAKTLGFPVITARLALTYGKGQSPSFLLPALIDACANGKPITINRPDDRRDLIHVDDVIEALILLSDQRPDGCETVNVATGRALSMRHLASLVVGAMKSDPALVSFGEQQLGGQQSILCADTTKAQRELGWQARIALEDGLRKLVRKESHDAETEGLRHAAV